MNPVQQKIPCVYQTGAVDEPSKKRQQQTFKVVASRDLNLCALRDDISSAKATEKLDGTCCLIGEFEGKPWLWARHDRKPSKGAEKRFAQFKRTKLNENGEQDNTKPKSFEWDPVKDFKEVPDHWMPALGLEIQNGFAVPDSIGHTPGWVPVQQHIRQHCWHLEAVDMVSGTALVLREADTESRLLLLESVPLSSLLGQTCELIGTNINGNPYGLGTKKHPLHILVPHGSVAVTCPDPSSYDELWEWLTSETGAGIEGVVWHCKNGNLYKLHRHHFNLKWPDQLPALCQRKVKVQVQLLRHHKSNNSLPDKNDDLVEADHKIKTCGLLDRLLSLPTDCFSSLPELCNALAQQNES